MIVVDIDNYIKKNYIEILIFLLFNFALFFVVSFSNNPLPFFLICTIGIVPFYFLFQVKGIIDSILLLIFISFVQVLYLSFGTEAVFVGIAGLLIVNLIRSFIEGFSDWKRIAFKKEILLFTFIVLASIIYGVVFLNGIKLFLTNCVVGIGVFIVTHHTCRSLKIIRYMTYVLLLIFLINALYAIFDFTENHSRAVSMIIDSPTYSGHLFAQGIAIAIGTLFSSIYKNEKKWIALVILTLVIALFFTLTRAAYLSMGFLILLLAFYYKIPKRYIIFGILSLVFIMIIIIYMKSDILEYMFKQRMAMDFKNFNLSIGSIAFRYLLWKSSWEIFLRNPVFGIGFDNFVKVNPSTTLFPLIKGLGGANLYAHNVYLQLLAETGIIGFSAFIFLLFNVFKKIQLIVNKIGKNQSRYLLLGYAGGFGLWLFMAMSEAAIYTPVMAMLFYFYLGTFSGFHKIITKEDCRENWN